MSTITPHHSDNQPSLVILAHEEAILGLAYFDDGRRVVTGSLDRTVRIWNVGNGDQEGTSLVHDSAVWEVVVTRDGTKIISAGWGGAVKVWDVESHKVIYRWTHGRHIILAVSPDDRCVAVGGNTVGIYTLEGIPINIIDIIAVSLCFSPDGSKIACGRLDISVYDVKTGTRILGPLQGHRNAIQNLLWSRDDTRIFSSSSDNTIRCWNPATGEQIGDAWTGHTHSIKSLSLSPDGYTLASASSDRTIRFWDATTGDPIGPCLHHAHPVNKVSFSPFGESVASAGRNGKICLWQAPSRMHTPLIPPDLALHPSVLQVLPPVGIASSSDPRIPLVPPLRDAGLGSVPVKNSSPAAFDRPGFQATLPDVSLRLKERQRIFGPFNSPSNPHQPPQAGQFPESQRPNFNTDCQPPRDLTSYIVKDDDHYIAGGGFGDVYKCWCHDGSPKQVAVKAFRFSTAANESERKRSLKMLRRELGIWKRLDHKNVVPFLGIAYGFGMQGSMSLVSLWMPNESLHNLSTKYDNNLGIRHRLQLLSDIANGLQYLHSVQIVHGDLNSNNVLLDADFTARLTDFGYASLIGNIPEALAYLQRSTARSGAFRWIAPEQINSDTFHRTTKTDIYSFGCLAIQVLSGKPAWSEVREDVAVVLRLAKGEMPGRPESRRIDDSHWDLIQQCCSKLEERPSTGAIALHIERFLEDCPPSPPLHQSTMSWPSHDDFQADDSFSEVTTESTSNCDADKNNNNKRPYHVVCDENSSHLDSDRVPTTLSFARSDKSNSHGTPQVTRSDDGSGVSGVAGPADAANGEHPPKRRRV